MITMETTAPSPATPERKTKLPLKEALSPKKIEELRERQKKKLAEGLGIDARLAKGGMSTELENERREHFHEEMIPYLNEQFLAENGINHTHPRWHDYMDLLDDASIDIFSHYGDTWDVNPGRDADGNLLPTQKETYEAAWQAMFDAHEAQDAADKRFHEELETDREKLTELREALAKLSAKRMGRGVSLRGTKKEFERLQKEYNDALIEVGQKEEQLREQDNPDRDEAQKRLDVMMDLLDSEMVLRELTNENLQDTKLAKLTAWMNKGSGKIKFIKMAGVGGAVAALTATFLGTGLVAAGTTTALVAAGAGLTGRFITNFIRKNIGKEINVNETSTEAAQNALGKITDVDTKTHEDIQKIALIKQSEGLGADIREQQKLRRRTMYKAGAIALLGTGLSAGISAGLDAMGNEGSSMLRSIFAEKHYGVNGMTSNGSGYVYGQNETQLSKGSEPKIAGSDVYPKAGAPQPESAGAKLSDSDMYPKAAGPEVGTEAAATPEFSLEALTIDPGEGLFKTFNEMKIPSEDHAELLQKVGPKLAELKDGNGQPFAYLINGEPGNWGIRMTPDGKMPVGALETIYAEHQQMINTANAEIAPTPAPAIEKIDVIDVQDVASNDSLQELATVEPGMGGREYVQSLGFDPDAWNMIQHQMYEDYPNSFIKMSGGNVGLRAGELPDEVAADLFNRLESVKLPSGESLTLLDTIQPSDVRGSVLEKFSFIPENTDSVESYMRENGLGHAWLDINNPATASELAKAAPDAFKVENGSLELIPKGRISEEGLAIIANHLNAVERALVGIG